MYYLIYLTSRWIWNTLALHSLVNRVRVNILARYLAVIPSVLLIRAAASVPAAAPILVI